ncbi:hypothetical protein FS749_000390 [Ceratobasidium sp. UAMH 11750]|nr:hypothetical protein FS749_000390 [Ceratobasidium sp. UAMH 11750]
MLGSRNTDTAASPLASADEHEHENNSENIDGRNNLLEWDDALIRVAKRPLPVHPALSTQRHACGKPGALQDIMKMPIDVFTEIASYLEPSDLLSLIRTTKFFRRMLLRRSASQIWRRAGQNIPGVPPCPSGMSEPQYTALMFSRRCTLCGGPAKTRPDLYLRVRLCQSCCKTKLISRLEMSVYGGLGLDHTLVLSSDHIGRTKRPTLTELVVGTSFSFIKDVEAAFCTQRELIYAHDEKRLLKWVINRRDEIQPRLKDANRMMDYTARFEHQAGPEREEDWVIHQRLRALGWTEDDLLFDFDEKMDWEELFKDKNLLTADGWTNSLPELNSFLYSSRARRIKEAKDRRLQDLLTYFKRATHPFKCIINAVGIDFSRPLETFPRPFDESSRDLQYPCPNLDAILEWDCFKGMSAGDGDVSELDQLFEAWWAQIEEAFASWRTELERRLVVKFELISGDSAINTVLTVCFIVVQMRLSHVDK